LIDSIEALGLMMDDTISLNMDKFIENLDKNVYTALNEMVEESDSWKLLVDHTRKTWDTAFRDGIVIATASLEFQMVAPAQVLKGIMA
jgi:hypothetical protein